MFKTHVGPVEETASVAYLRPETAQGIFINFKNVMSFARKKPPFGIAQIGKSFRNEITPGNFIFRTREFEQMEMEFFVPPDEAARWYEEWKRLRARVVRRPRHPARPPAHARARRRRALALLQRDGRRGVPVPDRLVGARGHRQPRRLRPDPARQHSGEKLEYMDTQTKERYVPHVIEPAAGCDRAALAFLADAYDEEEVGGEQRTVLKLHPQLAPVKVAVLPLVQEGRPARARPRGLRRAQDAACRPSTTRAARSASATAARTRSARRTA